MGKNVNVSKGCNGGFGFWVIFGLMYIHTSDTVEPFGKLEFFWRMLAGPFNFLPFL
jgi:hypothetical protein